MGDEDPQIRWAREDAEREVERLRERVERARQQRLQRPVEWSGDGVLSGERSVSSGVAMSAERAQGQRLQCPAGRSGGSQATRTCCRCTEGDCRKCKCTTNKQPCDDCHPLTRGSCRNPHNTYDSQDVNESGSPGGDAVAHGHSGGTRPPRVETHGVAMSVEPDEGPQGEANLRPSQAVGSTAADAVPAQGGEISDAFFNDAYDVIVHWDKSFFGIPTGASGKAFTRQLTTHLSSFTASKGAKHVELVKFFILPALMLQKVCVDDRSKDNSEHLARRLELWKRGEFRTLLREGLELQGIPKNAPRRGGKKQGKDDKSRRFGTLMAEGNVHGALRLLKEIANDEKEHGVLTLDEAIEIDGRRNTPRQCLRRMRC